MGLFLFNGYGWVSLDCIFNNLDDDLDFGIIRFNFIIVRILKKIGILLLYIENYECC